MGQAPLLVMKGLRVNNRLRPRRRQTRHQTAFSRSAGNFEATSHEFDEARRGHVSRSGDGPVRPNKTAGKKTLPAAPSGSVGSSVDVELTT